MRCRTTESSARHERGTVMIMVVGVLAMLFIIGSTLLIVSRFERQTAQVSASGKSIDAVGTAITEPVVIQLRDELLGQDETPYNTVPPGFVGDQEGDYGEYPGWVGAGNIRNGDLLLSSSEPYVDAVGGQWRLFARSWNLDNWLTTPPEPPELWQEIGLTRGPVRDADGDGVGDSKAGIFSDFSGMFGGGYDMYIRVIAHGGMVVLDPLTHPALLAQVIHPLDSANLAGFLSTHNREPTTDEREYRRRFFLPGFITEAEWNNLSTSDPRRALPVTMGYTDTAGRFGPHYWPFDPDTVSTDNQAWQIMLRPGLALSDPTRQNSTDFYSRRQLITSISYDDILRPVRDETRRLLTGPDNAVGGGDDPPFGLFYDILNPASATTLNGYGIVGPTGSQTLAFNAGTLRTQFSLRDALQVQGTVPPYTGAASYRRAMQLTAYFLAMIQHSSVPGASVPVPSVEQSNEEFRTATQLAVNAMDFADADQQPTYFEYDNGGLLVRAFGVERQPYITEAYARPVLETENVGVNWQWRTTASTTYSLYAVELYNPYDVDIKLGTTAVGGQNYEIRLTDANGAGTVRVPVIDPSQPANVDQKIPPHSYLVITNHRADPITGTNPFFTPAAAGGIVENTALKIEPGENVVRLVRLNAWKLSQNALGQDTSVEVIYPSGDAAAPEIDRLEAYDWPEWGTIQSVARWAQIPANPGSFRPAPNTASDPANPQTLFVWDSSLQRHKEPNPAEPVYWHFTLSRQMVFPLTYQENTADTNWAANPYVALRDPVSGSPQVWSDPTRPPQHNLMGSAPPLTNSTPPPYPFANVTDLASPLAWTNQDFLAAEFAGRRMTIAGTASPSEILAKNPIAPFPVLVSDRGINPTTGAPLAFPTTGTLLLVTRYAHLPEQTVGATTILVRPLTVAATLVPEGVTRPGASIDEQRFAQMCQLDNGHLPIFDDLQRCQDLSSTPPQGRFGSPWGQLIFDYFTALPLEEVATGTAAWAGASPVMQNYPLVESADGTRVLGRINLGVAPWWVLDGLPLLPNLWTSIVNATSRALDGLPVAEVLPSRMDYHSGAWTPPAAANAWQQPGYYLASFLLTDTAINTTYPSASPVWAKYMVSYREARTVDHLPEDINAGVSGQVGFAGVGELCNVVTRVHLPHSYSLGGGPSLENPRLDQLRVLADLSNGEIKPYGYLGYLQLVAPIVRLEDWATVKSHVFTIYAGVRTTTDPSISLRTQVTIDRTRCLANPKDLPERVSVLDPISYFNAVDD